MKVYKIEVLVQDTQNVGEHAIRRHIQESADNLDPQIMSMEETEIEFWSTDHPINKSFTQSQEYDRLFSDDAGKAFVSSELFYKLSPLLRQFIESGVEASREIDVTIQLVPGEPEPPVPMRKDFENEEDWKKACASRFYKYLARPSNTFDAKIRNHPSGIFLECDRSWNEGQQHNRVRAGDLEKMLAISEVTRVYFLDEDICHDSL